MSISRRYWPYQPPFPVGPNASLLGADAVLWSAGARQALFMPQSITAAAEGSWNEFSFSPVGRGAKWSRNASGGIDFGTVQPLLSSAGVTMLVVAELTASANQKVLASQRLGSGSVAAFSLAANTSNTFAAASGAFTLYCRNTASGGTPVHAASADAGIDGSRHCWVFANDTAGGGYAVRDGVQLTLTTNTAMTGTYVTNAQKFAIGNAAAYTTNGAFVDDEPIYLVIAWPRLIPLRHALYLSRVFANNIGEAFAPLRGRMVSFSTGAATHTTTGALASQAAAVAGTATHLTLHATTGALASAAATIAGAAVHPHTTTGALSADAATIAGTAVHPHTSTGALASAAATIAGTADHAEAGQHPTSGALAADAAVVAGTAAHLTLHTSTGALAAADAAIAGTAAHATLHTTTGALAADPATISGAAQGPGTVEEARRPQGGGRSRKPQRRVVEIDGEDFIVNSVEEAQALLERAKEQAKELAGLAVKRAAAAKRRPVRKVLDDARRLLEVPSIEAPEDLQPYVAQARQEIREMYESALVSVEIAALLSKRQRQEEDDEDVLLLIA